MPHSGVQVDAQRGVRRLQRACHATDVREERVRKDRGTLDLVLVRHGDVLGQEGIGDRVQNDAQRGVRHALGPQVRARRTARRALKLGKRRERGGRVRAQRVARFVDSSGQRDDQLHGEGAAQDGGQRLRCADAHQPRRPTVCRGEAAQDVDQFRCVARICNRAGLVV